MSQQPQNGENQGLNLPDFSAISSRIQASRGSRGRLSRRGKILILVALLLLLSVAAGIAISLIKGRSSTVTYQYQSVLQNDFTLSVQATGPIQSAVYDLTFSGSGKISEIDVQVGQTVKQGQLLAKLDETSLQDAVNAAQAQVLAQETALTNAQNNLAKAVAQSNVSVQAAQIALKDAQASYNNTVASTNASIAAAQLTMTNDMAALDTTRTQQQDSINSAQTALHNAQTSLNNTQATANVQLKVALATEQAAIAACKTPTPTPTPSPTPTGTATTSPGAALVTSSVSTCIQNAQNTYKQTVDQINATVATAQAQVATAQQALTSAQAAANAAIQAAQNKVTSDQQALSSAQAQGNSNNTNAQNQINADEAALTSTQASASAGNTTQQGQVNSAQAALQGAAVALQTAKDNLNNNILKAPHGGIVTVINGTVGGTPGVSSSSSSSSSSGASTFIQISDTSSLQIVADVNESDTAFLRVGESAQFAVSAYPNRAFTGTVAVISPVGQTVSNVVTYPVTINIDMSALRNVSLLPGMTASVTIVVVQRPNAVLIPVTAVNFARTAVTRTNGVPPLITAAQASSVLTQARQLLRQFEAQNPAYLQDNPTASFVIEQPAGQKTLVPVPIVLGLTDDTFYEVLSGLTPGQVIVVAAQVSG